jgi:glutathione peroxidase
MLQGAYKTLAGEEIDLSDYLGQVVLVVNTASLCGFTKQYADLEELNKNYPELVILGFPSGSFGGQELEAAAEISGFCQTNYSISFPLFEKSDVLNDNQLFLDLAKASEPPSWNFTKYLIGKDGQLISRFAPDSNYEDLIKEIEREL